MLDRELGSGPALPTGIVTFLFTDIEGSTTRWERQQETMALVLQRHDALLRDIIEGHEGVVFKTVGDAFYAVFARAPDAVAAALAAQRALQAQSWQEVGSLRVRMALHSGAPKERGGDYFGPPLNRVARLLAAGHGGQALLSRATYELVRDELPANAGLLDLGEHRLKDLNHAEHIFQLVVPDLRIDFPSLKTLDSHPHNLPLQPNAFIGREQEVVAVGARLLHPGARLLTLTGPGGTGKTRLALQVAHNLLDAFVDGIFFVNLAPISDPSLVVPTITQALKLGEEAGQALLEHLQQYLHDKQILLLLDNFEQVVEAAPRIADLLAAVPQLKVLVTSRVPLHLYGEQEFFVPPLSLPNPASVTSVEQLTQYDAVKLFVERAQAVKGDFQVTKDNAPVVAEICVRLDGLPLAIELAASRSKLFTPQALLARLDKRLKLLTGGARNLPARQQTLRATIEWSYNLLEEGEQKLFRNLAVFVGGCTLEAVEAICSAENALLLDPLEGVEHLLNKSLLRQEEGPNGEPRFLMLETIHEYAQEQLDMSGETDAPRQAHAHYYLALTEEAEPHLIGADQVVWLERLELERANLRAAFEWTAVNGEAEMSLRLAGGLWKFWEARGYFHEGHEWLTTALARTEERSLTRARALLAAGSLAVELGRDEEGRLLLEEALTIQRELQDHDNLPITLNRMGFVMQRKGNDLVARLFYEESLAASQGVGNKRGITLGLGNLATTAVDSALKEGDYALARFLVEESVARAQDVGDPQTIGRTITNLGHSTCLEGNYAVARSLFEDALAIFREADYTVGVAVSLNNLGVVAYQEADYSGAQTLFEESLSILRAAHLSPRTAVPLANLGLLAYIKGDYQVAYSLFMKGLAISRETGNKRIIAHLLACLGWLACVQTNYILTRALLVESLTIRVELGFKWDIVEGIEKLACLALAEGEFARAARLWGALHTVHLSHPLLPPPPQRHCHERLIAAAHVWCSATGWGETWSEGRAMMLEDATRYALEGSHEARLEKKC